MVINKKKVGQRIHEIRKQNGYSMDKFGKLIDNVPRGSVNSWEKGVNLPNKERIKKIALIGNMSKDELLYGPFEDYISDMIMDRYNMRFPAQALTAIKKYADEREISYGDDIKLMELLNEMFSVTMLTDKPASIVYTPLDENNNIYLGNMMMGGSLTPRYLIHSDSKKNALHVLPYFLQDNPEDFYKYPDFMTDEESHSYFTENFPTVKLGLNGSKIVYYGIDEKESCTEITRFMYNHIRKRYETLEEKDIKLKLYSKFLKEIEKETMYLY